MAITFFIDRPNDLTKTFENLESELGAFNGAIKGNEDEGIISCYGVNVTYSVGDEKIKIDITKKPLLVSEELIKDALVGIFNKCSV